MPQSGATTMFLASTYGSARRMRAATCCGVSGVMSERSMTPSRIFLPVNLANTAQSSFDCAVSIETCAQLQPASSGRNE